MEKLDGNTYIPIVVCSEDLKVIGGTLKTILEAVYQLNKVPAYFHVDSTGLLMARNAGQQLLQRYYGNDVLRGFYLDSDIIYNRSAEDLIRMMKKADEENCSFILPYKDKRGYWNVFKDGNRVTDIEAFKDDFIGAAGLGFYYGDIFPSYRFLMTYDKENDVTWGEDLNFFKFLASKQVSVKCESITVGHLKGVQIW